MIVNEESAKTLTKLVNVVRTSFAGPTEDEMEITVNGTLDSDGIRVVLNIVDYKRR